MLPSNHSENSTRLHVSAPTCQGKVLSRLPWRRNQAELLQEAQGIPLLPVFKELPSRRVGDGDARHRHLPARRGKRHRCHQSTSVGATKCPACHHPVPFSDQIFNREMKVWEGVAG